jgi:haloalkane dehalogenase
MVENVFVEKVYRPESCAALTTRRWRTTALRTVIPGSRASPTLTWPRRIPMDGDPSDVHDIVVANRAWLASTPVPKLFINGDPGALLTGALRQTARS